LASPEKGKADKSFYCFVDSGLEMEPLARIQRDGTLAFSEEFSKQLLEANGHGTLLYIHIVQIILT
jgi:hypothetical protein